MKHISSYKLFLEEINPNTPQGYMDSLSKKPKLKTNQKPTDDVDSILQKTEDQKKQIVAKKDAIEKGLLNNIKNLEPENQKSVQTQIKDYKSQVKEFDRTVKQINQLNKTLKKSNIKTSTKPQMAKARSQNNL